MLLWAGANVNICGSHGNTALIWVSVNDNLKWHQDLLTKGANVNLADDEGLTPLMVSSMAGHERICYTLITAGADVNMTDANHKTTLTHSIAYCISQSFFAKIRIPVMTFGYNVQYWSSSMWGWVRALIVNLWTVNIDRQFCGTMYVISWTVALILSSRKIVNLILVYADSDVNICDTDGFTPLAWAATNNNEFGIKLLLKAGANVNNVSAKGMKALMDPFPLGKWDLAYLSHSLQK